MEGISNRNNSFISRRGFATLVVANMLMWFFFVHSNNSNLNFSSGRMLTAYYNEGEQREEESVRRRLAERNPDEERSPYQPVDEFVLSPDGMQSYFEKKKLNQHELPVIYFVTPTYNRTTQMVDMIRLSQTLMHDRGIYWIVIEDADTCTRRIRDLLDRTGLMYAHLHTPTVKEENSMRHRGVMQRNQALDLIDSLKHEGVVYFGDDDNAYDVRLFAELRKTRAISVFGVAFVGAGHYERCVVDPATGEVSGYATNFRVPRSVGMDMGGLAFHTNIVRQKKPRFQSHWMSGLLESEFVKLLIKDDKTVPIQPLNNNCMNIYVWHVKTAGFNSHPVEYDKQYYEIAASI